MNSEIRPGPSDENVGELLYNGIRLPQEWPPRTLDPKSRKPISVPYLESPPRVIPIDVGRQLLVDDFLIAETTLKRRFYQARKYKNNPVLEPQTELELNDGYCPAAVPFSDGVFYDAGDNTYKMWYHAGWFDATALATSEDGLHWERPEFDVIEGTNCVVPPRPDLIRDGVSVWIDYDAKDPAERYKMTFYARTAEIIARADHSPHSVILGRLEGDLLRSKGYPQGGRLFTSPDGIHWTERAQAGPQGDNTTFFYNPFRKKWVFSIRTSRRNRTRDYWEHADFIEGANWVAGDPVFWSATDDLDLPDPVIGEETQLYKIDAVGYESIMLGLLLILRGPHNSVCLAGGYPKITELTVGYSRDGFHWHRPDRTTFIAATRQEGDWDRGYVHSPGGVCLVVGDTLRFYYGGWSGKSPHWGSHMYAGASTGVAFLRRDGFASMDAGAGGGSLTTRPVVFGGKHLFVNADTAQGELRAEVLDEQGATISPFTPGNCVPVSADTTLQMVTWGEAQDLSSLSGKPVRFRFHLTNGKLYAFWVSPDGSGASHGYVAAGGPGFTGPLDTQGSAAYKEALK